MSHDPGTARIIIIVGGGPVGMVLALNLAALGTRSILINREPRPRWHPKGSTQNARTMEHYRRLGIVEKIRAVGLPRDLRTDVVYFTTLAGHELARIEMPTEDEKLRARATASAVDQVVEPIFRCNQMHAEAELFRCVQACPLIDSRYGSECVDWREDADGVTAVIEDVASGRRETMHGRYLAGCDGGHGIVRDKLGIGYQGDAPKLQAYLGGPMVSIVSPRARPVRRRARQLLAILGGEHAYPQQHRRGRRQDRVSVQHPPRTRRSERRTRRSSPRRSATASATTFPSSSSATAHGPRARHSSPSVSARAVPGWRETRCICSRRPAASA